MNGTGLPGCGEADAYWADDVHVATGHNGEMFKLIQTTMVRLAPMN